MDGNLQEILFLEKLDEPITKRNIHKVRCGLHSNIPHCCIRFFIKIWSKFFQKKYQNTDFNIVVSSYIKLMDKHDYVGYIRCIECLLNNRKNHVKRCLCGKYPKNCKLRIRHVKTKT